MLDLSALFLGSVEALLRCPGHKVT